MVDYTQLSDLNAEYTMRDLSGDSMEIQDDTSIRDVQTAMVDGNYPWVLVRVYTDPGVVGTSPGWGSRSTLVPSASTS